MISSIAGNEGGPAAASYREEYVRVNGVWEYLLHYPAAPEAPVLLHIHGGPGAPASVFAWRVEAFPRNYSIVYYDQRGSGKTLRKSPLARLSMDALERDLLETVLHVKRTYRKDRIGILGHSWGSVLGGAFALKHPEHVSCYIGCGQMYCFAENEKRAMAFLRDAVRKSGDQRAANALARLDGYPAERCGLRALLDVARTRALQGRFGLAATMDAEAKRILRGSPITDRLDTLFFALGGLRCAGLMREFWNYDLRRLGCAYRMPVCYIMGDRDRTTPHEIAREYFEKMDAPRKAWYSIPDAGHFAMLDNAQAWRRALAEAVALTENRKTHSIS